MKIPDGALRCQSAPTPDTTQATLVPDLFIGTDAKGNLRVYRTVEPITNPTPAHIHSTKEPTP